MSDRIDAPFYTSFNGATVFVKEGNFFRSQKGLTEPWGKHWTGIDAKSVGDARRKYAASIGHELSPIYWDEP